MSTFKLTILLTALSTGISAIAAVSHARISEQSAEKIATRAQPGAIESRELQHEHGKWIYSFDIRGKDRKIHQVHVDARSGKVVSRADKSQGQEAQEGTTD
jgi:uncharacterized membrane protein YkoI